MGIFVAKRIPINESSSASFMSCQILGFEFGLFAFHIFVDSLAYRFVSLIIIKEIFSVQNFLKTEYGLESFSLGPALTRNMLCKRIRTDPNKNHISNYFCTLNKKDESIYQVHFYSRFLQGSILPIKKRWIVNTLVRLVFFDFLFIAVILLHIWFYCHFIF